MFYACMTFVGAGPIREKAVSNIMKKIPEVFVSVDRERKGCFWNQLECLKAGISSGAPHITIFNDDVELSSRFRLDHEAAVKDKPDQILCLYSGDPRDRNIRGWRTSHDGLVGVGYTLPRDAAIAYVEWVLKCRQGELTEDGALNLFAMCANKLIYTTVPSLLEHLLPDESTQGNENSGGRKATVPPAKWVSGAPVYLGMAYLGNHWKLLTHVKPEYWAEFDCFRKAHRFECIRLDPPKLPTSLSL